MRAYLLLSVLFFFAFAQEDNPLFVPSKTLPKYNQEIFETYVKETKEWLLKNRVFLTKNRQKEIEVNAPFELRPKGVNSSKGILLVHGLGDSPAYFNDLSNELIQKGFLVRTGLLTGHGSKPADLLNVEFEDWKNLVSHHIKLLQKEVAEVWLGGFSTGTNLITSYAIEHQESIEGLLLFSPGFASDEEDRLPWSGIGKYFKTWLFQNEKTTNILRYSSLSMNAANLYYQSLKEVQGKLEEKKFTKPVIMTISENDSVIEPERILNYFSTAFINKRSRLIWFGQKTEFKDSRVTCLPSFLPKYQIGNFSHLAVLFKEENPIYGKNGNYKMLHNGQDKEYDNKEPLWYSAWGHKEEGKYFARLTWNPYFKEVMEVITEIIE